MRAGMGGSRNCTGQGLSINGIRKERGIGYGTAWNYVRALEQG